MARLLGPYTEELGNRNSDFYSMQKGVRTLKHDVPTVYERSLVNVSARVFTSKGKVVTDKNGNPRSPYDIRNATPFVNGFDNYGSSLVKNAIHNKALAKTHDKLGYAQGFFETWFERQKAAQLINQRSRQLLRIVRSLGNPRKAAKLLKRKLSKAEASDFPSLWLEYNFAIKPLVYAVEDAVAILTAPFPRMYIRGRARGSLDFSKETTSFSDEIFRGIYGVEIGVTVAGINANVIIGEKLGINKPLTSAWAVVPWSWCIDYFVNVGEFLSDAEPRFPGLRLENQYNTISVTGNHMLIQNAIGKKSDTVQTASADFAYTRRRLGGSSFKLNINPSPLNLRQASYTVSALALTAKGMKR